MKTQRFVLIVGLMLLVQFGLVSGSVAGIAAEQLPAQLSDEDFWKLSSESSEPDGTFRSDNLLSNESYFQFVIPKLNEIASQGHVYMGVGPEQNFTYMAALKPRMAFIIDIRRGNLDLQLMYKALFELSKDRADFVTRLFSRKRPQGLGPQSTVREIFTAVSKAAESESLYEQNLQAIKDQLTKTHQFPLSDRDLEGVRYVYSNFRRFGPNINYGSSGSGFGGVSYLDLMVATDAQGTARSYLANEESFEFLKALEGKNLVVPLVGNFAGPKAIRAVGKYLKENGGKISAFYLSNVEQFLQQDGIWDIFCRSVATLPLDESSTFIRSVRGGQYGYGSGLNSDLGNMASEVSHCAPERPR
jgi:hypothetical protein